MKNPSPKPGALIAPKRTRLNRVLKNVTLATVITTGSIGMASTMAVPDAQAFGLSDIKKAAKKAGGAIKKGAKKTGNVAKKVGKVAVPVAKIVAIPQRQATNMGLKAISEAVLKPHAEFTRIAADALGKDFGQAGEDEIKGLYDKWMDIDQIAGAAGRAAKKAGKKVGKVIIGRNKIGGSLPRPDNSRMENALADYANRRGGLARMSGGKRILKPGVVKGGRFLDRRARLPLKGTAHKTITRRSSGQKFRTGVVRDGFFHGVNGSRPIGGIQQRKVQGISRENLKPGKRHSRREMIGRDKSVFGRPLYRKGNRKAQGIRLKDIRKSRKQSRRQRIGRNKSTFGRPVFKTQQRKGRALKKRFQNKRQGGSRKTVLKRNKRFNSDKRRSSSRRAVNRKANFQKRARSNRGRFGNKTLQINKRKTDRNSRNRDRRS